MRVLLLFICFTIGLALYIFNPSIDKHREFIKQDLLNTFDNPDGYIEELVDVVVQEKVIYDSYLFFSIGSLNDLGQIKKLSVGIFGFILPCECIIENYWIILSVLILTAIFIYLFLFDKRFRIR